MDWLYLIGRVLFSLIFILSGLSHLTQTAALGQYAASKGVPAPRAATIVGGLMILAGGLSVLLGIYMEIGPWLIVFFLLGAAAGIYNVIRAANRLNREADGGNGT